MKVLGAGSRGWTDREMIHAVLAEFPKDTVIVHGGARGADIIIGEEAEKLGLKVESYPADWSKGKGAGFYRNLKMLNMLDPSTDRVIAFWDGESKGTAHTIAQAKKLGILVATFYKSFHKAPQSSPIALGTTNVPDPPLSTVPSTGTGDLTNGSTSI